MPIGGDCGVSERRAKSPRSITEVATPIYTLTTIAAYRSKPGTTIAWCIGVIMVLTIPGPFRGIPMQIMKSIWVG